MIKTERARGGAAKIKFQAELFLKMQRTFDQLKLPAVPPEAGRGLCSLVRFKNWIITLDKGEPDENKIDPLLHESGIGCRNVWPLF